MPDTLHFFQAGSTGHVCQSKDASHNYHTRGRTPNNAYTKTVMGNQKCTRMSACSYHRLHIIACNHPWVPNIARRLCRPRRPLGQTQGVGLVTQEWHDGKQAHHAPEGYPKNACYKPGTAGINVWGTLGIHSPPFCWGPTCSHIHVRNFCTRDPTDTATLS
jgi:hypothetical protein